MSRDAMSHDSPVSENLRFWPNLRRDARRLKALYPRPFPFWAIESLLFENGFQAIVLYRMAHWFKRRGIPFFGPFLCRLSQLLTGVEIAPGATIGPGLMISHGQGIVIGQWATIGRNCHLHQQVTLGAKHLGGIEEMPTLGDDVFVGAGARLVGDIEIGDGAVIGTNVVVTFDVPEGAAVLPRKPHVRLPDA